MDLKAMATQMLMAKLGSSLGGGDSNAIGNALSGLLGNDDGDESSDLDLGSIVSKLSGGSGGIGGALQSWLGDGDNDDVSESDITSALGADKISAFAQQLGLDEGSAASGLKDLLPQLIDKNSSGGSLLSGALGGLAKNLFK